MIDTNTLSNDKKAERDIIVTDHSALVALEDAVLDAIYIYLGGSDSVADTESKIEYIAINGGVRLSMIKAAELINLAINDPAEKEISKIISIMLNAGLDGTREVKELRDYLDELKNSNLLKKFHLEGLDLGKAASTAWNIYYLYDYSSKFMDVAEEITDTYDSGNMPSGNDLLNLTLNGGGTITTLISEMGSHLGPIGALVSDVIAYVGNTLFYTISVWGNLMIKISNDISYTDLQADIMLDESEDPSIDENILLGHLKNYFEGKPENSGLTLHEVEYCFDIWGDCSDNDTKFANMFENYIPLAYANEMKENPGYDVLADISKYFQPEPELAWYEKLWNFF